MLISTLFREQNRSETTQVKNATTLLQKSRYTNAGVVTQGSFTASFPGTNEPDETGSIGTIWPSRDSYALDNGSFTITALEPDSRYYCVFPIYLSDTLERSEITLSQEGAEHVVARGTVAFLFGSDYAVNGATATGNDVIACESAAATILAGQQPCRIVEFKVTPLAG
jgi:hypothetical protein